MTGVLDSWALLAWLQDEGACASVVEGHLQKAERGGHPLFMSMINVGEVFYRLARSKGSELAQAFLADLRRMPITVLPTPNRLVLQAAELKATHAISYADAFAAAVAIQKGATLVTGDPELKTLGEKGLLRIEWLER